MADEFKTVSFKEDIPQRSSTNDPSIRKKHDQMLNSFLDGLRVEAERIRSSKESIWNECIRAFRGDISERVTRAGWLSLTKFNQTFRLVNMYVAHLTDTKPKAEISSTRRPDLHEQAKVLKRIFDAIWDLNHMDLELQRTLYDLLLFGRAFWKVIWDPGKNWGEGDISIVRVDPRWVYTDDSDSIDRSQYILYKRPVPLWEVRALWPAKAKEVQPDYFTSSPYEIRFPSGYISPQDKVIVGVPKVWIEEWWIRDPSLDESGNLIYPSGRHIVRTASGVILSDEPNPYFDPWPGPWVEFVDVPDPDSPWGISQVSQLVELQRTLNNALRYTEDSAALNSGGVWIIDEGAVDQQFLDAGGEMLIPRPAKIIWKKQGSELRWDRGGPLPSALTELVTAVMQSMELTVGLSEASAGKVPRGLTAGAAIEALQLATQTSIRLTSRRVEAALTFAGQLIINRILQFYTTRRVFEILGPQGAYDKVEYDPLLFGPGALGEDYERRFKLFRFLITPGSSLSLSKEKMYAYLAALYSMGAIDQEAFLEMIDFPNKEEIIKRMRAQAAMLMQAGAPRPRGRGATVARRMLAQAAGGGSRSPMGS